VNKKATPGVPWVAFGASKGYAWKAHQDYIVDAVLERLKLLSEVDSNYLKSLTPLQLVEAGFVDPVKVHVKNEPHKREKLNTGRVRIISGVSLVDELVERLLCGLQNNTEICNWLTIPSKPGIGLTSDEQVAKFIDSIPPNPASSDVKGYDWCLHEWLFELDLDCRIRLAQAAREGVFHRVLRNRYICLCRSLFVTSDGCCFEQLFPGIMKSGSYLTSSTNSRIRYILALLVGAAWALTMGDDCLEDQVDDAHLKYQQLGIRIKEYKLNCNEFCSHEFRDGVGVPLNFAKGLFRLVSTFHHDLDPLKIHQFRSEYRHSPQLPDVEELLLRMEGDAQKVRC
jgi:hypothetical protein